MHVGKEALAHLSLATLCVVYERSFDVYIHKERRCVGEIAETGVVGHHWENGTIVLEDGWLTQRNILESDGHLVFVPGLCCRNRRGCSICHAAHQRIGGAGREAGCGGEGGARARQGNLWTSANHERIHLLDNLWNVNIHKVIEGFDLVRDDLAALHLVEIEIENMTIGGDHSTNCCSWKGAAAVFNFIIRNSDV